MSTSDELDRIARSIEARSATIRKLRALRAEMRRLGLAAYVVRSAPDHDTLTVPCWERVHWLTGFTGGRADLFVRDDLALLWTDRASFRSGQRALIGTFINVQRVGQHTFPTLNDWLGASLERGETVSLDAGSRGLPGSDELRSTVVQAGAVLRNLERSLVDVVREDESSWLEP